MEFELLGWFIEYYIDGKYIGSVNVEGKDREVVGYNGRETKVTEKEIVCSNKRKIKPGTKVTDYLYPINGKIIKQK